MTDTHYACNEVLERDGGKASCCYCTGHECEKEYMSKPLHQQPNEVCMCCGGTTCGYSTIGCPWYVDREYLSELLEKIA